MLPTYASNELVKEKWGENRKAAKRRKEEAHIIVPNTSTLEVAFIINLNPLFHIESQ